MAERARCEICNRSFKDTESLAMHNSAKHSSEKIVENKSINFKKIRNWAIFILIVGGIIGLIIWSASSVKTLPPTDMQGHIESWPDSNILKEPIPIQIHKHILEHIPSGRPGVIINYNCDDYNCEEDLIEKLEAFTNEYDYVYVAPFPKMDAKIALIKLGKIEILKEYDQEVIKNFIIGF